MTTWKLPEATPASAVSKSTRRCNTCGEPMNTHKRRLFNQWVCDLVQLEGGHWVHANKTASGFHKQDMRRVVYRLIEDV